MKSENGVSQMRELKDGLAIPAHGSVGLTPGGYHLMFTHLTHPLTKGETVKATLNFEHAGPVEVEFKRDGSRRRGDWRHEGHGRHEGHEDVRLCVRRRARAFELNRHREGHRASKDARLSTGYGDAAIQGRRSDPSSLDRFACARDDDCGSRNALASRRADLARP